MHVTPEVAAGLYGEVRTLVDDARMARKDRVVRLRQVLEDSRLDAAVPRIMLTSCSTCANGEIGWRSRTSCCNRGQS